MIGGGGDGATEAAIGRFWIAIAYQGFKRVGSALERLAGQIRSASLSTQAIAPRNRRSMFRRGRFPIVAPRAAHSAAGRPPRASATKPRRDRGGAQGYRRWSLSSGTPSISSIVSKVFRLLVHGRDGSPGGLRRECSRRSGHDWSRCRRGPPSEKRGGPLPDTVKSMCRLRIGAKGLQAHLIAEAAAQRVVVPDRASNRRLATTAASRACNGRCRGSAPCGRS